MAHHQSGPTTTVSTSQAATGPTHPSCTQPWAPALFHGNLSALPSKDPLKRAPLAAVPACVAESSSSNFYLGEARRPEQKYQSPKGCYRGYLRAPKGADRLCQLSNSRVESLQKGQIEYCSRSCKWGQTAESTFESSHPSIGHWRGGSASPSRAHPPTHQMRKGAESNGSRRSSTEHHTYWQR